MNFTEAVKLAKEGKETGYRYLYDETYQSKYYLALQYMKNEDAAQDVVQDAYIKAFSKLDTLDYPEAFSSWMGRIVANTAKNELVKKNPLLFTDLDGENQEGDFTDLIVDDHISNQPELSYTRNETREMVRELIDSLSDEQRICILMFHIEGESIRDIAAALECSENTVKSRLNYGRKNLKVKAEELQKKGYKLFGIGPVVLLVMLMQKEETIMAAEGVFAAGSAVSEIRIFQYVNYKISASGTGAVSAGTAKTTGFLSTAAGKILLTVGIGILAGGAIGAASIMYYDNVRNETSLEAESESDKESEPAVVPKSEKKEEEASEPADKLEITVTPEPTPEARNITAEAMESYRSVISRAASYDYSGPQGLNIGDSNGVYRYALVMMHPEDPVPTLLLSRENTMYMHHIRLFQYDPQTGIMIEPPQVLVESNTLIGMENDGNGIQVTQVSGGTGDTTILRTTLNGDSLSEETQWTGRMDQIPAGLDSPTEIIWYDMNDLTAIDQQISSSAADGTSVPSVNSAPETAPAQPEILEDGNRIVFSGTINTYSYNDVLALQGIPDPNPQSGHSESFRLILLDQPQTMELLSGSGDGYRSGEVRMIKVTSDMSQYEGQHLTFSIDPASTYWPSDTSLPVGEPNTADIHVLG